MGYAWGVVGVRWRRGGVLRGQVGLLGSELSWIEALRQQDVVQYVVFRDEALVSEHFVTDVAVIGPQLKSFHIIGIIITMS